MNRPVALVTGELSPYRREPFRLLAEAEGLEVLTYRAGGESAPAGLTVHRTSELGAARLVASGRYRAVIHGLGGRVALPATYLAARRARIPFLLWASLWAHPRTAAHALSRLPTAYLYRHADAVVTYGAHVSRHVGREPVFEAPQAVSAAEFGRPVSERERAAWRSRAGAGADGFLCLFVGRLEREKGIEVLLEAWRRAAPPGGLLAIAGGGPLARSVEQAGDAVRPLGVVPRGELPGLYAAADALVLPSVTTATFKEPWGLVVNEAMLQATPTIVSDAVGAAAGGLVVAGRNGLVVPEGDPSRLAAALGELASSPPLRAKLGAAAREDVRAFSEENWVAGMRRALSACGVSREKCAC